MWVNIPNNYNRMTSNGTKVVTHLPIPPPGKELTTFNMISACKVIKYQIYLTDRIAKVLPAQRKIFIRTSHSQGINSTSKFCSRDECPLVSAQANAWTYSNIQYLVRNTINSGYEKHTWITVKTTFTPRWTLPVFWFHSNFRKWSRRICQWNSGWWLAYCLVYLSSVFFTATRSTTHQSLLDRRLPPCPSKGVH